MVFLNGVGERLARKIMVLIGPALRVGNLIRVCRRGQNLRQQRIGIKRDARHQSVEFARGQVRRRRRPLRE